MTNLKSAYLLTFNASVVLGWTYILFLTTDLSLKGASFRELWQAVKNPLLLTQSAALLEVAHSLLGVVRAPIMTTVLQVASRVWLVWGILVAAPAQVTSRGIDLLPIKGLSFELNLVTLLAAWSVTEIIRYSFFAVKELGYNPFPLLWLRYTTFIVLYPLGVASELTMVYLALPHIRTSRKWSIHLPNTVNFAFDYYYFCLFAVVVYIPGFPMLYSHMLKQRKKVLSKPRVKQA